MAAKKPVNKPAADCLLAVKDLRLDLQNPRIPNEEFRNEDDAIKYLIDTYDVEELVQSILSSGWIDFEPLIVEEGTNVVYEGNRRLAALQLIGDEQLRTRVGYKLPEVPNPQAIPDSVRARIVKSRKEARRFIAFKHINGPFKWDAYAKAKYATDWLSEGEDIDVVSRILGDNHNTIKRLVAGFRVLHQAQARGFDLSDRTKKRFAFSHLYTAVSRPSVREYLGMSDASDDAAAPVPVDHGNNLDQLMSWLYGQESKKEPTVITSQNPNLNELVRVLENKNAVAILSKTRRLDQAFAEVEPPSIRFKDALVAASRECENALGLSAHYDGDEALFAMGKNLATTVRTLRDAMAKKAMGSDDGL